MTKKADEATIEMIHEDIAADAMNSNAKPESIPIIIRILIGLFICSIIVLWVIPHYAIKYDPQPNDIPTLDQIFGDQSQLNMVNISDYGVRELGEDSNSMPANIYDFYKLIDLRDPYVKLGADRISSIACRNLDNFKVCQVKAIFYFVRDELRYSSDPLAYEFVKTPRESIIARAGDCDDASVLLVSMLGSVGISSRLVFIPRHVYVEAYLPDASKRYKIRGNGDYVALDPTCHGCKFGETPPSSYKSDKNYLPVDTN